MRKVANDEVCREAMVGGLDVLEDRTRGKGGLGEKIKIGGMEGWKEDRLVRLSRQARTIRSGPIVTTQGYDMITTRGDDMCDMDMDGYLGMIQFLCVKTPLLKSQRLSYIIKSIIKMGILFSSPGQSMQIYTIINSSH